MPAVLLAACLAGWPAWEPVEAMVARADTIVEADVAADGQFVVKASLKGREPPTARPGAPGRALLFFSDGVELSRWPALKSGEFDLPHHLLVPLEWPRTSVSREAVSELLRRLQRAGVSGWTVNEQECTPCSLREAFIQRALRK